MRVAVLAFVLVAWPVGWSAAGGPAAPPAPAAPAAPAVVVTRTDFDVFPKDSDRKVGAMGLVVTEVPGRVILDMDFTGPFRDEEAGFKGRVIYDRGGGAAPPAPAGPAGQARPLNAEVSTRAGRNRLMDAKVEFEPAGGDQGRLVARFWATGYADRKGTLFAAPKEQRGQVEVPQGVVLTYAAFLYFGPKLLRDTGGLDQTVYAALPKDLDFPEVLALTGGCRLVRVNLDELGACRIELRQMFPGDNYKLKAYARYDFTGRVQETGFAQFTMRPSSPTAK